MRLRLWKTLFHPAISEVCHSKALDDEDSPHVMRAVKDRADFGFRAPAERE